MSTKQPRRKLPKHLVCKIQNRPLAEVREELIAAHSYLAKQGKLALSKATEVQVGRAWGSAVKRVRVELPSEARPSSIPEIIKEHSLIEIVNQCATLDRLLDAVEWAMRDSRLAAFQTVELCHPTTSSSKSKADSAVDNDLILTDGNGRRARFEVSDVASEKDGNDKELRDLISLGIVTDCSGAARLKIEKWPEGLLYLVVSTEFSNGILSRKPIWIKQKHLRYNVIRASISTTLLEVMRGEDLPADTP